MITRRPAKTLADYLVIGVSPVLIMALVGSLSFFLVEIFYRGEAVGSVRWVLFWFILAVVLVSRIGIEQGPTYAAIYGIALAGATWLYLVQIHPAYLVGMVLLALVWWCANKLTRDCTLIDEDEDASGDGLLEIAFHREKPVVERVPAPVVRKPISTAMGAGRPKPKSKPRPAPTHAPGLWLIYFSLAALPLFGIGQMLLPGGDERLRRIGFALLFLYMTAAVGLLLTTSFLGLRRYLRQRRLAMPGSIAFGWVRFGVGVALVVLAGTLLLPRPGATDTWMTLRYQIDYQLRRASEYALKLNPPGKGQGRAGNQAQTGGSDQGSAGMGQERSEPGKGEAERQAASGQPNQSAPDSSSTQASPSQSPVGDVSGLYGFFRILVYAIAALLLLLWLIRHRHLISQIAQTLWAALVQFFRRLLEIGVVFRPAKPPGTGQASTKHRPFGAYENPFVTGRDRVWPPEQVVLYSYEALRAWAEEQGVKPQPQQTAREYCHDLGEKYPELRSELGRLSVLYGHAAYGSRLPENCEMEPVKRLWRYLTESLAVSAP